MQSTTGASVKALRSDRGAGAGTRSHSRVDRHGSRSANRLPDAIWRRAIDLAARGTEKVAGHIEDVRQLSLSTGAAASQVLSSANELEGQAAHLSEQVRRFLSRVRAG